MIDRDRDALTWAEIAAKHGLGEKEAREAYDRFKNEIVPIIRPESVAEDPLDYLRMIAQTRARLLRIADHADNSSAAVGALREVMRSIFKEVELAQSLGLLPREVSDEPDLEDFRWLLDQFASVLTRYPIPAAAIEEIRTLARGDGETAQSSATLGDERGYRGSPSDARSAVRRGSRISGRRLLGVGEADPDREG